MKKILIPAMLATLCYVVWCNINSHNNSNTLSSSPMSNSSIENPNQYAQWEKDRLADPATGEIPLNIRKLELKFASHLPKKDANHSLSWIKRGPSNVGGRTRAIGIDVLNDSIMLAGGVTGGMWRTTDGGQQWIQTTAANEMHSVTCVTQDIRTGHENTWYYGTGEYYGIVSGTAFNSRYSGDGLFKSTDNGMSWIKLSSTSSGTPQTIYTTSDMDFVWNIVVDPSDTVNDVVLAAVYNGIFRSTDGGISWSPVLGLDTTNVSTSDFVELQVTSTGVFYATLSSDGPDKGIYRSVDGITWTHIAPTNWPGSYRRNVIGINPSNENEVYFLAETSGYGLNNHSLWKYTYLTGDGSGTNGLWVERSSNLPNGTCTGYFTFDFGYYYSQSSYDMCIAVHPTQDSILFIGGTSLYRSNDAFATNTKTKWIGGYQCGADPKDYVYPNHHPDQHTIRFLNNDSTALISGSDGGVAKTVNCLTDSVQWQKSNNGYVTSQFYSIAIEPGNVATDFIIGGLQDNGVWFTNNTYPDSAWIGIHTDDGAYTAIGTNRNYYIMSSQAGRTYKKDIDDNGNVLAYNRIDPTGGPGNYSFINPFILDPLNSDRMYFVGGSVLWTNNDLSAIPLNDDWYNTIDTGWTKLTVTQLLPSSGYMTALAMSPNRPNSVYIGTSLGHIFRLDSANSANATMTEISDYSVTMLNRYISSIAVNPFDSDDILITYSNYNTVSMFHTGDGGVSWKNVSGNLEENVDGSGSGPAFYWSAIYPTWPPTYFAGTSVGLFSTQSLDSTATIWVQEGASTIGNVVINMMAIRTFDGTIAIATHGNGIFSTHLPDVTVATPTNTRDKLSVQCFPVPATNQVNIELMLSKESVVTAEIYNITGGLISSLYSGTLSEGKHNLVWNVNNLQGNHVPAGIYFLYIKYGEQKMMRKLIVQ